MSDSTLSITQHHFVAHALVLLVLADLISPVFEYHSAVSNVKFKLMSFLHKLQYIVLKFKDTDRLYLYCV